MKTPEERGPVGAWIVRERERLNLSVEEVIERLADQGQPVSASYMRGIEAGRRPSSRVVHALEALFGSRVPAEKQAAASIDTLVAMLAAQTAAINELVVELRLGREAAGGIQEGSRRVAERLAIDQPLGGAPVRSRRPRPRGTRRESPVAAEGR